MELFDEKGCLTDEGLHALIAGELDELGRLEAAEHLAYCDRCLERYTALLTPEAVEQPPHPLTMPVLHSVCARIMQNTAGRAAVAAAAAAVALTFWHTGVFQLPKVLHEQAVRQAAQQTEQITQAEKQAEDGPLRQAWDACADFFGGKIEFNLNGTGGKQQ